MPTATAAQLDIYCLNTRFATGADGWIHLAPFGEHPHEHGLQIFNQAEADAIVSAWEADGRPEILVDFDHFSLEKGKPTEAAGWIKEITRRDDGLWGRPEWTDVGKPAVEGRRYRFTSPVWQCAKDNAGNLHPETLLDVALTNQPNLRGLVPLNRKTNTTPVIMNKELLALLGLAEGADEAAVIAAVKALKDSNTELQTEVGENRKREAGEIADKHGITDAEAKNKFVATYLKNRAGAVELLALLPAPSTDGKQEALTNKKPPQNPKDAPGSGNDTKANRKAAAIRNRATELQTRNKRLTFPQAWKQAEAELGD
jgi:phage I-like protein